MIELFGKIMWSAVRRPYGFWHEALDHFVVTLRRSALPIAPAGPARAKGHARRVAGLPASRTRRVPGRRRGPTGRGDLGLRRGARRSRMGQRAGAGARRHGALRGPARASRRHRRRVHRRVLRRLGSGRHLADYRDAEPADDGGGRVDHGDRQRVRRDAGRSPPSTASVAAGQRAARDLSGAVGYLALALSDLAILREFGLLLASGVVVSCLAALLVVGVVLPPRVLVPDEPTEPTEPSGQARDRPLGEASSTIHDHEEEVVV